MTVVLNTQHARALLRKRFAAPEWSLMEEVAPSTGGGTRYADAVAVNLWKSRGYSIVGFEIKVSRGDWQRELKKPDKAESSVFQFCDRWYIVAPAGVIKDGELPPTWGHLEVHPSKLVERVAAPKLDPAPVDRAFFASLMRRGYETLDAVSMLKQRQAIDEAKAEVEARVQKEIDMRTRDYQRLQKAIAEWEAATGLKFNPYAGPPIDVIKLAQALSDLQGWRNAEPLSRLNELAGELRKAAEIVGNAIAECGLGRDLNAAAAGGETVPAAQASAVN